MQDFYYARGLFGGDAPPAPYGLRRAGGKDLHRSLPLTFYEFFLLSSGPSFQLSFSFSCFRFSWECSRRIDKLKRALINSKSWTFTWIMFFDPFFWIFSNANIISICSCLCYVDVPWHSWTSYMIGPSMRSLRSLTQGHSTLVEKNGLPWASSELRSNEERVEWWTMYENIGAA